MEILKENDMTQERKELLIKDLCARLPYGVKVKEYGEIYPVDFHNIIGIETTIQTYKEHPDSVKPILFPLSAIKEELEIDGETICPRNIIQIYFHHSFYIDNEGDIDIEGSEASYVYLDEYLFILDTFHRYHIDYRNLIGQGLAISVFDLPENPYK